MDLDGDVLYVTKSVYLIGDLDRGLFNKHCEYISNHGSIKSYEGQDLYLSDIRLCTTDDNNLFIGIRMCIRESSKFLFNRKLL